LKFRISNFKYALGVFLLCAVPLTGFALDRDAFTFTNYELRAQVVPAQHGFSVDGRITLRNDSATAQRVAVLQISPTLAWQSIKVGGKSLAYVSEPYTTDIDHTGGVTEAIVTLPGEIAPGNTIDLEIAYSGIISSDATRLTRIGAPAQVASRSEWDQIADAFTAVRGVGYVCWYPVAINAVSLSEGSEVFAALGAWKTRHLDSTMHLRLAVASDKLVVTNGRLLTQNATATTEGTVHERQFEFAPMGWSPPTFAIGDYTLLNRPAINVLYLPGHLPGAQEYTLAAEKVLPTVTDWFGRQREKVAVVDLPEGSVPFDSGAILFAPLNSFERNAVEVAIAHQLTHACFSSRRPWIAEGTAHFAQALVRERQDGRKAAIAYMQQSRPALAEAEKQARTPSPNAGAPPQGEPLIRTTDELYYRAKAMFVWWMLRDMAGDDALQSAFHEYRAADDKEPSYMQRLIEAHAKRGLEWFFDDWVYRDRGLPDFRITAAYPSKLLPQNVMVTVTVENAGDAAAEVPVIVPVENGEAMQRVKVTAAGKSVARLTVPAAPAQVVVNDGSVPESDVNNNIFVVKKPE
jgi:hypothetical protein